MQTQKQASPFSNMSDEQLIFFGFDDLSSIIEHEAPSDKSVFESSNGVFGYNEPFCKHCIQYFSDHGRHWKSQNEPVGRPFTRHE